MNTLCALVLAVILPEFDICAHAKRSTPPRQVVATPAARPVTTAQAVALSRDPQPVRPVQTIQAAPVQQRVFVRRRGFFRRR